MDNISITIKKPFITTIDTREHEILIDRTGIDATVEYGPDKRQDIKYSDIESIDFKPADETDGHINIIGTKDATIPFDDESLNLDMKKLADFLQNKLNDSAENLAQHQDKNDSLQYCYKCGSKIPKNSQFCPKCGADQSRPLTTTIDANASSNAWGIWLTIGWVCFAIALIPRLSVFQLSAFVIGLTVQHKYGHKGAGMALWISSLVVFLLSFMFGFMLGYYYGI